MTLSGEAGDSRMPWNSISLFLNLLTLKGSFIFLRINLKSCKTPARLIHCIHKVNYPCVKRLARPWKITLKFAITCNLATSRLTSDPQLIWVEFLANVQFNVPLISYWEMELGLLENLISSGININYIFCKMFCPIISCLTKS